MGALRAHGDRRQRRLAARQRQAEGKLVFEPLEPRVLLSADALSVSLGGDLAHPMAHDVVVDVVTRQLDNRDHTTVQMVQVVEHQSGHDQVLASAALDSVRSIQISSGVGNTSLTVDTASFGNTPTPAITFRAGTGNNTLAITGNHETDWDITGKNAGVVGGSATVSFTGVANLTGGSDNTDVFTVEQGGALSGSLDGGARGNDSLIFKNNTVNNAIFTATGPQSGTVDLDGSVFTYAGLEPITFSGNANNISIVASAAADQLSLADTAAPAQIQVASLNNSLESVTFTRPNASLTVNMGDGDDSLQIGELRLFGASLTVDGAAGSDSIAVNPSAYVSTRATVGDALNAASVGNSGNLSLTAETITVGAGASLYTNANSGFSAGDISLTAIAQGGAGQAATSSLAVHGAQVVGGNVNLTSTAIAVGTVTQPTLATLDLNATAETRIDGTSLILATAGDASIGANTLINGHVTANATPLGALNADAAVALSHVTATADTVIADKTLLGAIGTLAIHSIEAAGVNTLADGSAGGATAVGGSVALADVTTRSTALIDTGVKAVANQMVLGAASNTVILTSAIATAGGATANGAAGQGALAGQATTPDGNVTVGAAIAGTKADDTTDATSRATSILTKNGFNLVTVTGHIVGTGADASAVQGGPGVGAAIALNAISADSNAVLDGQSAIGGNVTVTVGQFPAGDVYGAAAHSGAGATSVGVAGALAVNGVSDNAFGGVAAGAQIDLVSGNLSVGVTQNASAVTDAFAFVNGQSGVTGIGASVAIAPVHFTAEAGVQAGAQLTVGDPASATPHSAGFTVNATRTVVTDAGAGSAGGTGTAAALALTIAQDDATANLDAGAKVAVQGNLALTAQQTSNVQTKAVSTNNSLATVVGFGIALDETDATSAAVVQARGNVSLSATGQTTSTTTATGGPRGAHPGGANAAAVIAQEIAFLNSPPGVTLPTPADADGAFGVAAAMALGVAIGRVNATVQPSGVPGTEISAAQISLTARGAVTATTRADASADGAGRGDGGGVGAALALQTGQAIVIAEDDGPIAAPSISLVAGPIESDVGNYTVQAISGAGASNVGVAGAMAIGGDGIRVQALLNGPADATSANGGGSVSLSAKGHSTSNVDATALAAGRPLGVGAAFALDVTDATITAAVEDGGSITGAPTLSMSATGGQSATTTAEGGALGGTATGAAVALAVVTDEVTSQISNNAVVSAGRVGMLANGASSATTTTTGAGGSQKAGIGASLALGIQVDDVAVEVAGRLDATGAVNMAATGNTTHATTANAGARGAAAGGLGAGLLLGNQLNFLNHPNGLDAPTLATADGALGVAAALAFGVDDSTTETAITGRVVAGGDLTMKATGGTTANTLATAAAVDTGLNGTGVAAAAGIMIATPSVTARIDGRASAANAALSAGLSSPGGHVINAKALSGVGSNDTGIAGAFALAIGRPVTEADIGGSGLLDVRGGNATLTATGASQTAANAAAANLGSGKFGLGASVALDVAADDTHAMLEQGASVLHVNNLTLTGVGNYNSAAHAEAGSQSGGVAGAVAINVAPQDTEAEIASGTAQSVAGNLKLSATQTQFSRANAIGGTAERGGGFGAAIAVNAPVASTSALLDRGAAVGGTIQVLAGSSADAQARADAGVHGGSDGHTADDEVANWLGAIGADGSVTPPVVPSIANATTGGAQQLGLSLPDIGAAAALAVDAAFGTTSSSIAGGDAVTAGGNVTVRATGSSKADAVADASALTTLGAVGFGFAVDYASQGLEASINSTPVTAPGITVEAMVPRGKVQASSAEARSGAGATAGVAGAIALNLVANSTEAQIIGTQPIVGTNFITVHAAGDTVAGATAGYLVGGIVAGAGVSLAGNLVVDHTEASVDAGASLDSLGTIRVEADGVQSLGSDSAGTALAGLAAVPASLTADTLLATTAASIGKGAQVDANLQGGATQQLQVLAQDTTNLDSAAGSLGFGLLTGAGAAAQFADLVKQTTADVDGDVQVQGSVVIDAESAEKGVSAADAGSLSAAVAVAGGAGVQMGQLLTHAAIDGDAHVHAVGDVVVTAHDNTELDVLAGGFDAALAASAGAGVAAIAFTKTTEALVDDKAQVDAEGRGNGTQVATGFGISFISDNPGPGEVGKPFLPTALKDIFGVLLNNPIHNLLSPVGSIPTDDFASSERVATPTKTTVHGLAVTALSHDDLALSTMGLGAAGLAPIELSASGIVAQSTTRAKIGAGALVNQGGFGGSTAQSVLVAADGDTQAMGIAGTAAAGGLAAVGPATALITLQPNTEAFIGAGAKVSANDAVTVRAVAQADLLNDAAGIVASLIGVAGSADAIVFGGHDYAYIDANAVVMAGGSVSVLAEDSGITQNVAGALSLSSGFVAAGGSASLSLIARDTEAWIGSNAQVFSLGATGEAVPAIAADPNALLPVQLIRGVSVLAVENQLVMDLVANGAGGNGGAAFIGSAAGVIIGNTTAAFIADGATVQAGVFNAQGQPVKGSAKTVAVGALDQTHSWDGIANVVDADLAISGAADAGVIRDTTVAKIEHGATVKASADVDVAARSAETVDSFVGGLGLTNGGIELNVSASVYSIGAVVPGDLLDPLQVVGGPGNLEGYLDGLLQGMVSQAGQSLVGVLNKYAAAVGGQQAAATQLAALTPSTPVTTAFTANNTGNAGTLANVDDATVTAFGKVQVTAIDAVTPDLDTSFTFSHSFGNNSQNLNLSLDGGLLAGRANATASVTGGSQVQAAGDIDVTAHASTTQNVNSTFAFNSSTGNAAALVDASRLTAGGAVSIAAQMDGSNKYSGILPGFNGLKIRTSYNHEVNTTTASVADGSVIQANKALTVSAVNNTSDNVKADGATLLDDGFAGAVTLGVALAWNDLANTTSATIDNSKVLANSVAVTATATTDDFALGFGVADGSNNQVAIGGSAARNILNDTVSATIETSSVVAPHGVDVAATDTVDLTSISGAAVGRTNVGLGGAVSINTTNDAVTAEIGDSEVDATVGAIQVTALGTANMNSLAAGFAQGKNVAVGAGLPVDNLGMDIAARVMNDSDLTAGKDVTVSATGNGTIKTLAGGVTIATGQVGAGAAIAINNSTEHVAAEIGESTVTATGNVDVEALSNPTIWALAIGFAYAPTVGAGASVSTNNINDVVSAKVDNDGGTYSNVFAGGHINVSATDTPNIKVLTGGVAASNGQVAASASVSKNNIDDEVDTSISGAHLTSPVGPIIVQAVADPAILAIAIAGSGAQGFAGNGAIAVNSVSSTVNVTVGDVQADLTAPVVSISGADNSNIGAVAFGIAAAGKAALSGSVATNNITGGMLVQMEDAGHIKANSASITATNSATIKVITGAAEGAGTASLGGAVSVNNITDNATAQLVGGRIDAHTVNITGTQNGKIQALAAVGNGAGTAAFGASVTTNNIYDAASAIVTLGAVINTGSGGKLTLASSNSGEIDSFSGAVNGAGTAAVAAAVANNNISEQNNIPGGADTELMDSTVTGGSATVQATDSAVIKSIAISGSGAGTVAFGGSVAKSHGHVRATVAADDNTVTLTGALAVSASDQGVIKTAAADAEGAGTAAGGAAIAINTLDNDIAATLSGGNTQAGSVSVSAIGKGDLQALAAVGAGAGTVAGDVSDTENIISGNISAKITGAASIGSSGAVNVTATDSSTIKSLSGSVGFAGTAAFAGARAHNRIGDVPNDDVASDPKDPTPPPAATTATIDGGSVIGAASVGVTAKFNGSIETIAVGASGAGTVAIAGSLSDNLIGDQVSAAINGPTTDVVTTGAISVNAENDALIHSFAGGASGAGTVAGGAAGAVNKLRNSADATINAAQVWSLGSNVSVHATGGGEIKSLATAGGISATVAVGAAVAINDLENVITAEVVAAANVRAAQNIDLLAKEGGTIDSGAGALAASGGFSGSGAVATNDIADDVTARTVNATLKAIKGNVSVSTLENASIESGSVAASGGTVGVTATVSVNKIDNILLALVHSSSITAGTSVFVQATDTSSIKSLAGQLSVGLVGVGGAASYNEIENTVRAAIESNSSVVATSGDVLVQTAEHAKIGTLAAGGSGGVAGIGGSVSVSIIANVVQAQILNANVTAFGNVAVFADDVDSMQAYGGQVAVGAVGVGASVAVLTLESQVLADVEGSNVVAGGGTPALSTPNIDATTGKATVASASGLAVVARDQESADVKAISVGGGVVGVAATVADVHTATQTDAHIAGSQINKPTQPGSGVYVHAAQSTDVSGLIGNVAAGLVAVGAAVQVSTIDNNTRAYIADQQNGRDNPPTTSGVYANSINVSSVTHEKISANTVGVVVGLVAGGGSVAYSKIESTNDAFVRNANLAARNGSASITVAALDNADIDTFAGNVAVGFVGVGAAVGVATIDNSTHATLLGATLNANGAITVRADSTEALNDIVGGGAGGAVGVAGSILVDHLGSDTEANTTTYQGHGTLINQDPTFGGKPRGDGGSTQSVNIIATDHVSLDGKVGVVSVGIGAFGAAIHVGSIANRVVAAADAGTVINAAGDVSVIASSDRDMHSVSFAATGGLVALNGAFSILSIGGDFDSSSTQEVNSGAGNNSSQLSSQIDSSVGEKPATSLFNPNDSSVAADAAAKLNQLPSPSVGNPLANSANVAGTFAALDSTGKGGAPRIHAGGNISLSSTNTYAVDATAGSVGVGFVSLGVGVALTTINDSTKATVGDGSDLYAGHDISVHAEDATTQQSDVLAYAGTFGAVAVGGAVSHTTLHLDVAAALGQNVTVEHAASLGVTADQSADLRSRGFGAAGGVVAAGGVESKTTIEGSVVASTGHGDQIGSKSAIGSLNIAGSVDDKGDTQTTAGVGGVAAGEVNVATTTVKPTLLANLGDHSTDNVSGSVNVSASSTGSASAQAKGIDVGGLALGLSKAHAELDTGATASIGNGAQITAGGDVTVHASHKTTGDVDSSAGSSGGGLISGNGAEATSIDNGSASANVGGGVTIDADGTVHIVGTAIDNAKSGANTFSLGLVAVGGQVATANTGGTAAALLGAGSTVLAYALDVEAAASDTSKATSKAAAGGIVSGVGSSANVDSSPTVKATIGNHAIVQTTANVDVFAFGAADAHGDAEGSNGALLASIGESSTNTTGKPVVNALIDHDSFVDAGGGVHVLAQSPLFGTVSDGSFNAKTDVDLAANRVTMAAPSLLWTGDQVVYHAKGGTPIGGLTDGRTYSVVTDNQLSQFRLGQMFAGAQVDADTSTIHFAGPSGFVTGDRVVYDSEGGPAIGGLVNGGVYYVRVIDPTTIKLATSSLQAVQSGQSFNPALIGAGGLITMVGNGFSDGEAVTYRTTGATIAGLVNGNTYFVQKVDANHFRLSALPGGPAINLGQGPVSGIQTLGDEGVALDGVGVTGLGALVFDLTGLGTGKQQFTGVGHAAAVLPKVLVVGYEAIANASGGAGFVGDTGTSADVTVVGTTTAIIGTNTSVLSGQDLTVVSTSQRGSNAEAEGDASGFVGIGSGEAQTLDSETTTTQVMSGAKLMSGQDTVLTASGQVRANGRTQSYGGGVIKTADTDMTVIVNPATNTLIGKNATITAPRNVFVFAGADVGGIVNSVASGAGLGVSSHGNGVFWIGKPNPQNPIFLDPAKLTVQVGDGSNIQAGNDLSLEANYNSLDPSISAFGGAAGAGVGAHSTADLRAVTQALVSVGAAKLTATDKISLTSTYSFVVTDANATTEKSGIGPQDPEVVEFQLLDAKVNVAKGALLTTHGLEVDATDGKPSVFAGAIAGQDNQPGNIALLAQRQREIVFNGDAVLLAGPAPELIVNRFGQIVVKTGVNASISNGTINVGPISDHAPGWVHFVTDAQTQDTGLIDLPEPSTISGKQGHITYENTFRTVSLANWSALNLKLGSIDPVIRTPGGDVLRIKVDDTSGFSVKLANSFVPTTMNIGNFAAHGIGNLTLTNVVEDPIGTVNLTAVGGNLLAQGSELVRGAAVTLKAGGNIGSASQRFAVDVVESAQAAIALNATAGGDLHMAVRARLRDPSIFIFEPHLGTLSAGSNIDLDLLPAVRDDNVLGPTYTVAVGTQEPSFGTPLSVNDFDNAWPNDVGNPPPLPQGIFGVGGTPVNATYTIGLLQAGGSINVIDPPPATVGLDAKVNLLSSTGTVSATMSGDVTLTELTGDLRVGTVKSTQGDVALTALNGNIFDPVSPIPGQQAYVIGDNVSLTASEGAIGTVANPVDVQLLGHPGVLTTSARDGVHVLQVGSGRTISGGDLTNLLLEEAGMGWIVGDGSPATSQVNWSGAA